MTVETNTNRSLHTAIQELRELRMTETEHAQIQKRILSTAPAQTGAEKISPIAVTPA